MITYLPSIVNVAVALPPDKVLDLTTLELSFSTLCWQRACRAQISWPFPHVCVHPLWSLQYNHTPLISGWTPIVLPDPFPFTIPLLLPCPWSLHIFCTCSAIVGARRYLRCNIRYRCSALAGACRFYGLGILTQAFLPLLLAYAAALAVTWPPQPLMLADTPCRHSPYTYPAVAGAKEMQMLWQSLHMLPKCWFSQMMLPP